VRIRLLGEVGVVTDHGTPVDVGPAKCRAVLAALAALAALAVSAGTAMPEWRLAELVWGEDPPRTAARTLQSYVVRLRKGLGHDSIVRVGAAYRLDVTADSVDVLRFGERMDAGDTEAALAEWTGLPLAGLEVVAEICRRLDSVPLAIELAAARTTSLTPADIAGRLDDQLRLLARGRRAGAGRHRTLRATVQWSYDLLSPEARQLFQRLSVFVGPFDLAAAETVAAVPRARGRHRGAAQ
jgi:Transcriptional regulatory protein, C terminal